MDISSYSNERILNTIKQSYNFDTEIVDAAKEQALKRGLMSTFEIDKTLEESLIKGKEIKQKAHEHNRKLIMGEVDNISVAPKLFGVIMPILILFFAGFIFFYTGNIFIPIFLGATAFMSLAYTKL